MGGWIHTLESNTLDAWRGRRIQREFQETESAVQSTQAAGHEGDGHVQPSASHRSAATTEIARACGAVRSGGRGQGTCAADCLAAADDEGKGYLTREQATSVVSNVAMELTFTDAQIQYIMTEADENHDGMM